MTAPIIFCEDIHTNDDLISFREQTFILKEKNIYIEQLGELFKIMNPNLLYVDVKEYEKKKQEFIIEYTQVEKDKFRGCWVYLPWKGYFIHMLTPKQYSLVRTNRNKNLITTEEQDVLINSCVATIGLSIGNSIATSLAYNGIGGKVKLAEFDTIDTSNLNRIRAGICQVGEKKIDVISQQIYEIDPFIQQYLFKNGLDDSNLESFFIKDKPDIIFEVIDDFVMKIKLRLMAKKYGVPVVMCTNIGDRVLIDIERFDLDKDLPLFGGRVENIPEEILNNPDNTDILKNEYAVKLVGRELIPDRALNSVSAIGKDLVARPQLMSTVTISSGLSAYIARKILLGETNLSGSYFIKFSELFF
ncbi:ThiF family adenylyltransferase [Patescibacteria group bacterium]|nr:ThiF family adenylyltransferase [Patescibacteria group bacterium]MBU1721688.1 ThiF family adenylyltransferase [Patescibacteria group bacterium]